LKPSSNASSACRIDWRPSRWLVAALVGLALLSAGALAVSNAPVLVAWPGALLALGHGLRLARREWRRPALTLAWDGGQAPARIVGGQRPLRLTAVRVEQRGSLAVLAGRDERGRLHRLVWWPDTLPAAARRQLRLAAQVSVRYDKTLPPVAA
jgi:toxin CptA